MTTQQMLGDIDSQELGYEILMRRKRKKLTQVQLAQLVGISRNYISLIERGGAANISMRIFRRLARVLYDNPTELIDRLWMIEGKLK